MRRFPRNRFLFNAMCWMLLVGVASGVLQSLLASNVDGSNVRASSVAANRPVNQDDSATDTKRQMSDRVGYLVRVSLPIDSKVSLEVRRTLKQIVERTPAVVRPEDRPVVVLEFETLEGKTGRGSELESCMSLARYLGKSDLNRLTTVAYVPASEKIGLDDTPGFSGQLNGHAVLVAIAANQIVLAPNVGFGSAGIDDETLDPLFRGIYRNLAEQKLTLPVPLVMSMLDKQQQLFRVMSSDRGVLYVDGDEQAKLDASGKATNSETIASAGKFALLTGQQMLDFGLIRMTANSRTELARDLDLAPNSLEGSPANGKNWKAVEFDLPKVIDKRTAKWIISSLRQQVGSDDVNLVILNFESNVGDVDACLSVAEHLAEYDSSETRTVAFVKGRVAGPVGLIALACGHLIMDPDSKLGGVASPDLAAQEPEFDAEELDGLRPLVQAIAKSRQTDWSVMMQMLDPSLIVTPYRHQETGQIRLMCNQEWESSETPELWSPLDPIGGQFGIDPVTAERIFLARTIAQDSGQLQAFYQLEEAPRLIKPSQTDIWVERLSKFLSSPFVAPWLIFGAMFFFSTEMSAPGLGVPGFLATICFVLFFWSQSLGGNANWLEILMFVVGAIFIGMEIFVIPGFGVFGIGGLLMVLASLVLASQSFLIPRSSDDFVQMAYSLLPVIGAGLGVICAAFAFRKIIPYSPFLKEMILMPRQIVDTGLPGHDPEAIVDWSHLNGRAGQTITRLNPSGKARIGGSVYDVISKGQMLGKGESIVVIEAVGNRIVVQVAGSVKVTDE
jgi:membrane-bound serine protease (ClpP class)